MIMIRESLINSIDCTRLDITATENINIDQIERVPLKIFIFFYFNFFFQLTIFRCSNDRDQTSELDEVIMTALFKAQHLSPVEQLSLALAWNRCDIAKKEIFIYGKSNFWTRKIFI